MNSTIFKITKKDTKLALEWLNDLINSFINAEITDLKFIGTPLRHLLINIVNLKNKDLTLFNQSYQIITNLGLFPKACKISGKMGKEAEFVKDIIRLLVQILPVEFIFKIFKSNSERLTKSIGGYKQKESNIDADLRQKNLKDLETLTAIVEAQSELHSTKIYPTL